MSDTHSPLGSEHACPGVPVTQQRDERGGPTSPLTEVVVMPEAGSRRDLGGCALLVCGCATGRPRFRQLPARRQTFAAFGAASHMPTRSRQPRGTGLSDLCPETWTQVWGRTAAFLPDWCPAPVPSGSHRSAAGRRLSVARHFLLGPDALGAAQPFCTDQVSAGERVRALPRCAERVLLGRGPAPEPQP